MTSARTIAVVAVCMVAAAMLVGPAKGQPPSCLPMKQATVDYALRLATGTDSLTQEDRAAFQVLEVPASEVEYVSDESVCSDAAREFKASAGLKGKAPAVHVVRIGTRYMVSSPEAHADDIEFVLYVIMDDQFNELAKFVS